MRIMKRLLTSGLVFTSLFAICCTSFAGDRKVYPGNMGVVYSGPQPTYNFGAIGNPSSTQWMYLDLPVIMDTGANFYESYVRALARSSSSIRCNLNTRYWSDSADQFYGSWSSTSYVSRSLGANTLRRMGVPGHSGPLYNDWDRHAYINCAIPPTYNGEISYIIAYDMREQ